MLASLAALLLAAAPAGAAAAPPEACPRPEGLSPVEQVEACEARLERARGAERERLLLALGLLHEDLPRQAYRCRAPGAGCPSHAASPAERALSAHAEANPGEFVRDEATDTLASTGLHLRRLLEASPRGPLAEPALAALAGLAPPTGCEGQPGCEVHAVALRLPRLGDYLLRFPRGAHAAGLAAEAGALLDAAAASVGDAAGALGPSTEELVALRAEAAPHLARWSVVAAGLAPRARGAACGAAAGLAVALADWARADPLLRCAAASPDPQVAARARQLRERRPAAAPRGR